MFLIMILIKMFVRIYSYVDWLGFKLFTIFCKFNERKKNTVIIFLY